MNEKMFAMKTELKAQAVQIRVQKADFKDKQRTGSVSASDHYSLERIRDDYRIKHIIYSMARGNAYEEIERTTTSRKCLSEKYVQELKEKAEELKGEDCEKIVCDCGQEANEVTTSGTVSPRSSGILSEIKRVVERGVSIAQG
jgi:hypothetical protein